MTAAMRAYYAGRDAVLAPQIVTVNPYARETEEYAMWWAGWQNTLTDLAALSRPC